MSLMQIIDSVNIYLTARARYATVRLSAFYTNYFRIAHILNYTYNYFVWML